MSFQPKIPAPVPARAVVRAARTAGVAVLGLGVVYVASGCAFSKPKELRHTVNGVEMFADGRVSDPGKRGAVPMTRPIADPWGPSQAAAGMDAVRAVPVNIFGEMGGPRAL